jgi:hypothetical protein
MTAQVATTPVSSGTTITELSGAAPGTDTVPAGCVLLVRNTGAGTHVLTVGIGATLDSGLLPGTVSGAGTRTITMTTGQVMAVRVPANYGDANGRVPFGVDGTPSEVKYTVIGI